MEACKTRQPTQQTKVEDEETMGQEQDHGHEEEKELAWWEKDLERRADGRVIVEEAMPDEVKTLQLPPGEFGLPLIGETYELYTNSFEYGRRKFQTYGPVVTTHLFGSPTVLVGHPEAVKALFLKQDVLIKSTWPLSFRTLLGECLITTGGMSHRMKRKALHNSALGTRNIRDFHPSFANSADEYISSWIKASEEAQDGYIDTYLRLKKFTFDSACRVAIGHRYPKEELDSVLKDFIAFIDGLLCLPVPLPGFAFYNALRAKSRLSASIITKIEELRTGETKNEESDDSLLGLMLQLKDENGTLLYSKKDLLHEMLLILFAGHDTTSTALSGMLTLLGNKPHLIEKLREEQRKVVGKHGPEFGALALKEMVFLDACMKETLVIIQPAGGVFREAIKDIRVGQYLIPKGYSVLLSIIGSSWRSYMQETNGKSTLWGDDWSRDYIDRFNPERWIDADPEPFHLPFGYGNHKCIGFNFAQSQIKILFSTLLRKATWTLAKTSIETPWDFFPLPAPADGLKVKFKASPL